jgi:NADPH:quinone reductase-like Zn-dependent oxidoreductase
LSQGAPDAARAWAIMDGRVSHPCPGDLQRLTDAIIVGKITVPIAATFPIEQIRDAAALQAGRHVHGKVVITL